jgi:hypothetical protein
MAGHPKRHTFVALVGRLQVGQKQHFIPVPDAVGDVLRSTATRRRIICQINGEESKRALHGNGPGEWKVIVGRSLLRDAGAAEGYPVEVVIWPDPDPEVVDLCAEFLAVLAEDPVARKRYDELTLGMKRSFALYVNGGKRSETRIKRSLELARRLRTNTLHRGQ